MSIMGVRKTQTLKYVNEIYAWKRLIVNIRSVCVIFADDKDGILRNFNVLHNYDSVLVIHNTFPEMTYCSVMEWFTKRPFQQLKFRETKNIAFFAVNIFLIFSSLMMKFNTCAISTNMTLNMPESVNPRIMYELYCFVLFIVRPTKIIVDYNSSEDNQAMYVVFSVLGMPIGKHVDYCERHKFNYSLFFLNCCTNSACCNHIERDTMSMLFPISVISQISNNMYRLR